MSNPTFSILMTVYNCEKYVATAIRSIIKQTFKDWELVIVDDASKDDSVKVIKKYIHDPRIKFIRHKVNLGYGRSLRTAINHSSGKIVCIVDSDDAVLPITLEQVFSAYVPGVEFLYTQYIICDRNLKSQRVGDCGPLPEDMTWLDVLLKTRRPRPRIGHMKTFLRSAYDKTEGFGDLRKSVDKDIVLKLEEAATPYFLNEKLYLYRKRPGNISHTSSKSNWKTILANTLKRRHIR